MMNNLNPSSTNQDEDLTTSIGSQKTYELKVFDENEAYRQLEIIQLILHIRKSEKKSIYLPHQKKQNIYLIADKNIHDSLRRIDPYYFEDSTCTSPEVDLFRKVLKENIMLHHLTVSQSDFWLRSHNDAIALAPNQFMLKAEILNDFYHQLACAIASDTIYQKTLLSRQEKSLNQNKKAKRLAKKLLSTFRRLLIIKMDFSIHTDHTVTLELLKTYLRMFIKKLHTPNDKVPPHNRFYLEIRILSIKKISLSFSIFHGCEYFYRR